MAIQLPSPEGLGGLLFGSCGCLVGGSITVTTYFSGLYRAVAAHGQRSLLVAAACLLGAAPAWAGGWPALESADFEALGGGEADAAVLIGIDDYPFLTPVVGAEANVSAWERYLLKGRSVPYARVRTLKGKQVNRRQVEEALKHAADQVGKSGTLYVVFVGHGAPAPVPKGQTEAHLLLGNSTPSMESFASTGLPVSQISALTEKAAKKGAKVVAVLDACFTGKSQSGGDLIEGAQFAVLNSLAAPAKVTMLTAASSADITGPLPGAQRPAFSYLVLGALQGWGDGDGDGVVTAQEAVNFSASVMLDAQRPERPALEGKDVTLAMSGGQSTPPYRDWFGVAKPAAPTPPAAPAQAESFPRTPPDIGERAQAAPQPRRAAPQKKPACFDPAFCEE